MAARADSSRRLRTVAGTWPNCPAAVSGSGAPVGYEALTRFRDGTRPVHLYGYGAYGISMSPSFSASRLSLLDRGFAYAIAHIRGGDEMGGMIMSLALAITLQAGISLLFSVDEQSVRRPVEGAWQIGQAFFAKDQLLIVGMSVLALAAFYFLIERTRIGMTIRAVAQDREVARLQGVSSWKIMAFTFALSCGLAGLSGALMAPVYTVHPYMGEAVVVKAFIIVVLGGLGSLPGAVVAALILSVTEAVASTFYNATVATMLSFLIVMAVLLVKPSGLMGKSS